MKKNLPKINNSFYDQLGEKWHEALDHPIAFLRAENVCRNPWITKTISTRFAKPCTVLDVGCGAGFLTSDLAAAGHSVWGIDVSLQSLERAQLKDPRKTINYLQANAYQLPFQDASFEVVTLMDILEHLEEPKAAIQEAARVLKPGGLFFFHTFNRTFWSWLTIIKGVEWAVANSPTNMHVHHLFIKPKELKAFCKNFSLNLIQVQGLIPRLSPLSIFNLLMTKRVPEDFTFKFSRSLLAGYIGFAEKGS